MSLKTHLQISKEQRNGDMQLWPLCAAESMWNYRAVKDWLITTSVDKVTCKKCQKLSGLEPRNGDGGAN